MLDNFDDPMQEELHKLQRLNREHAARLRQLGCDLSGTDFTATFQRQLDDLVAIQLETGLLAVTELNLQHWYQDRKLDVINGAQALAATRAHCLELEQRIAAVQRDAERVELLVREAQREFPASADAEREAVRLEREVQEKRHSLANMPRLPDTVHLVDMMEKMTELKAWKPPSTSGSQSNKA